MSRNTGSSAFADDDLKIADDDPNVEVIARLDRAIQYAAASRPIAGLPEYWITSLRG